MIAPQFVFPLHREIFVDNFAGGGGASTGIEQALGRYVDVALNHNREALAMHRMNHPQTEHYCEDIRLADPVKIARGRPVGGIWFSPDCKHFSKAKGGKPLIYSTMRKSRTSRAHGEIGFGLRGGMERRNVQIPFMGGSTCAGNLDNRDR